MKLKINQSLIVLSWISKKKLIELFKKKFLLNFFTDLELIVAIEFELCFEIKIG